jgi:hypothetical protein
MYSCSVAPRKRLTEAHHPGFHRSLRPLIRQVVGPERPSQAGIQSLSRDSDVRSRYGFVGPNESRVNLSRGVLPASLTMAGKTALQTVNSAKHSVLGASRGHAPVAPDAGR